MAVVDRFLKDARIGSNVELMSGSKEVSGKIVSLDAEIVSVKRDNGKVANIVLSTITYYEFSDEETDNVVPVKTVENNINTVVEQKKVEVKAETVESNKIPGADEVEEAIINRDINKLYALTNSREYMSSLGYTDDEIDRIRKTTEMDNYAKGNDEYSIASRLDGSIINRDGLAEKYYYLALENDKNSNIIRTKSARKIQSYYIKDKKYEEYLKLYDIYPLFIELGKGFTYVFHIEAYKELRKERIADLNKTSLDFSTENDYVNILYYLLENPDDYIANRITRYVIDKTRYLDANKLALEYINKNKSAENFEKTRIEVFFNLSRFYTLEELSEVLSVGNAVEEVIKTVVSTDEETGESEYELNYRDKDAVVAEYLEDTLFGVVRAVNYLKRNSYSSEAVADAVKEMERCFETDWSEAVINNNEIKQLYLLTVCDYIYPNSEAVANIRNNLRNNGDSELYKAIERYDAKKAEAYISNTKYLKMNGFSNKEIERLEKVYKNDAYAKGSSDYEVASRLSLFGFVDQASRYYINVANNPHAEKQKSAINQLVGYAIQTKDTELFEKYYSLLDRKQKKNESYLRFINDCKYYRGEYKQLYNLFVSDPSTTQKPVIYGALKYENNQTHREELINKACETGNFTYDFWEEFLRETAEKDINEYRRIINKQLNEYIEASTSDIKRIYELLTIDPSRETSTNKEEILRKIENKDTMVEALILTAVHGNTKDIDEEVQRTVVNNLNNILEDMNYRYVYDAGRLALRLYPENEELNKIVKISANGIDVYDMLPSGHDNYAKGKRLLLLQNDTDKAFECFIEEINSSDNKKTIALCGRELLKELYEQGKYEEVIRWGHVLVIDKEITEYSSLALDIDNAFEKTNDAEGKQRFISAIVDKANKDIEENEYENAVAYIKFIEILEKENAFVARYKELLEKTKSDSINLDENTFIGQANVYKYVDNDIETYIKHLKSGFENGNIEIENRTTAAALLLETIIEYEMFEQNMDFVDNINRYGVVVTEHITDMLYLIVNKTKGTNKTIEFFTNLLESADKEKRMPVLIKLEKIYENALKNEEEFITDHAAEQMYEYTQNNSSLQGRLCYIWVLAYTGALEEAEELLTLLPDYKDFSEEQTTIVTSILNRYFNEKKPDLFTKFDDMVKENTLYRLMENFKLYKDFVYFSKDEEAIYSELIKNSTYKINSESDVDKSAVIKAIYKNPNKYKNWYLYLLCVRNNGDQALKYCLNIILSILNSDSVSNETFNKTIYVMGQINPDIKKRYHGYKLYNKLYKAYLTKTYKKDSVLVNEITTFSMDKKIFSVNPETRKKMAEDYIHLFRLLDDRDDYIYVKSAMFIATNNKCEEYFYSLFKEDLLHREPITCLKMCQEMLLSKKGDETFRIKVLDDLIETSPEYGEVATVLKNNEYDQVLKILKDYPKVPEEEYVRKILKSTEDSISLAINILETVDKCYPNTSLFKKILLDYYKKSLDKENYEKMYQAAICIAKDETSESELFKHYRLCAQLALAMDKTNRMIDVIDMYNKQSLDKEYNDKLAEYCDALKLCDIKTDKEQAALLEALIVDNWLTLFDDYGIKFLDHNKENRILVNYSRISFIQNAFEWISIQKNIEESNDNLEQFKFDFNNYVIDVCGESIEDTINEFLNMPEETRIKFKNLICLEESKNDHSIETQDKAVINAIFKLWNILYGKETLISSLLTNNALMVSNEPLYYRAIEYYKDRDLLNAFTNRLFNRKKYSDIIDIGQRINWASDDMVFDTYFIASLVIENDLVAMEYISRIYPERYINLIILLKKYRFDEAIKAICTELPAKQDITNLVLAMIESTQLSQLAEIESYGNSEEHIALLKLFCDRINNPETVAAIVEKYGNAVTENNYISIKVKNSDERTSHKVEDDDELELTKEDCQYYLDAKSEVSLNEYALGIDKEEKNRLKKAYNDLGNEIKNNLEYRKELLTKMLYITKNTSKDHNNLITLGIVMYYSYSATNVNKARETMFETSKYLNKDTKHRIFGEFVAAICDMLGNFESVDDIMDVWNELEKIIKHILKNYMSKEFLTFFENNDSFIKKIKETRNIQSISQRTKNYSGMLDTLKKRINKNTSTPQFYQVYTKQYKIIKEEINRLSKDTIINLEVETAQCSSRGKICCVIQNVGKKPAENIVVKAVFEDSVKCKDNEKEIKTLYSNDISTFAFNIRCKEEGIQNYRIEISYGFGDEVEHQDYNQQIRIVKEIEYEHIGNLYSVAPVTSNAEFYGREREKDEILGFIKDTKYNTSMVMHGLKRVGKTSMLRYIERTMRDSDVYIPVYKSAQGVGEQNAIGKMFVETVIDELENIGSVDEKCRSYLENDYDKNPEQLYDFYRYLERSKIMGEKRILFMADEIEEIFDMVDRGIISSRFYKVLRVTLQELTSIRFIFCGADHLTNILYNHSLADVFEITKRFIISRLDEESMRRMIIEPAKDKISYTDRAVERIWHYTKGHTFYSKHICSKVIDILNDESRVTAYAYDIDTAVKQVMRVTEYFIYLSRFFSENDKQVIRLMCSNIKYAKDKVSIDTLENEYEGSGLMEALNGLEFKDIIEKTETHDTEYYYFSNEMFRLWYSKAEYITEVGEHE